MPDTRGRNYFEISRRRFQNLKWKRDFIATNSPEGTTIYGFLMISSNL